MQHLIGIFIKGGPVMWPILGLSVLGLAICVWKAAAFRRGPKTSKGLVIVSTIVTAEPMLGILGTVTGIMQTFGALNGADGAANPMAATSGIGEALITTAAGLVASLILLFPYNWLDDQVEEGSD
ncbi:MAG: MotA/TolQ/ExbB proton channel family protein [Kiritimatiellia bacterium]